MADDDKKPTPRKRAPRKKPAATASAHTEPVAAEATGAAVGKGAGTREVVTTSSTDVAVPSDDAGEIDTASEPLLSIDDLNGLQLGELIVHASTRDIGIVLDGASAAKVMSVFAGTGRRRQLQDRLIAGRSDMTNIWASIDLSKVIALSWLPGLPSASDRVMTVDPPVPDALIP